MAEIVDASYSLAALLIHASKQEVTPEKIQAVFSALNIECSSKVASMFSLSAETYTNLINNIGAAAAPAASTGSAAAPAAAAEPEEKSEESSDAVMGF